MTPPTPTFAFRFTLPVGEPGASIPGVGPLLVLGDGLASLNFQTGEWDFSAPADHVRVLLARVAHAYNQGMPIPGMGRFPTDTDELAAWCRQLPRIRAQGSAA